MRHLSLVVVAVLALALSGCGQEGPASTGSGTAEVSSPAGNDEGDLVLYVSNQSFDDERVHVTVTLDGEVVVDDEFDVEGQHTWVRFPLAVPAGVPLELAATTDSGATLETTVSAREDGTRAVIISHWTEGGSPTLEATVTREPVAFD